MKSLFSIDNPINEFLALVFDLFLLNILWIIFSLPIITIGASTTALFYVCGKSVRKEGYYVLKDFWKSFRENLKQATIIWSILLILFLLIGFNIKNVHLLGFKTNWLLILQVILFVYLSIITIYIFPVLSRFHITIGNSFRTAFFLAGKHFFSTILLLLMMVAAVLLVYRIPIFIMIFMSTYALMSSHILQRVFEKYSGKQMQRNEN